MLILAMLKKGVVLQRSSECRLRHFSLMSSSHDCGPAYSYPLDAAMMTTAVCQTPSGDL